MNVLNASNKYRPRRDADVVHLLTVQAFLRSDFLGDSVPLLQQVVGVDWMTHVLNDIMAAEWREVFLHHGQLSA